MNALEFATRAHTGALRWDKITPYIEHPKAVVAILKSWGIKSDTIIKAAYLHDVVEDTDVPLSEIVAVFGLGVAGLVNELTRPKGADYLGHCNKMSKDAALIKTADILHNITDTSSLKSLKFVDKRLTALRILDDLI